MMNETSSTGSTRPSPEPHRSEIRIMGNHRGEADAVEEWARAGARKLIRLANLYLRDEIAAEQVVREVMLNGLRAVSEGDAEAAGDTWLRRQTLALALRKLRTRASRSEPGIEHLLPRFRADGSRASDPMPRSQTHAAGLDDRAIAEAMRRHIDRLPELHRTVFILATSEGLDAQTIADHLAIREVRVRRLLHEARLALSTLLAPRMSALAANELGRSRARSGRVPVTT